MLNILPKQLQTRSVPRIALVGVIALVAIILVILTNGEAVSGGGTSPAGEAATGLGGQSLAVLALLAFVGGVVSFVSPCALPILPAYFAFAFTSGRRQIAANTLFFMLGMPLGNLVAAYFGWRWSFALVAVLAVLGCVAVWRTTPALTS